MMKTKKLSDNVKYDKNPFIGRHKFEIVRKRDYFGTDQVVLQQGTGELQGVGLIARHRRVDSEKYVKLFTDKIALWLELTKNAQRVLCYIISEMRNGSDKVFFDEEKLKKVTGYKSSVPIYSGLAELMEHQIIARTHYPSVYFINPYYMFNGDRILFLESFECTNPKTEHLEEQEKRLLEHSPVFELPEMNEEPIDFE